MSKYNTKYKVGYKFPVMMEIIDIDADDGVMHNYKVDAVTSGFDYSWLDIVLLEDAIASGNPEVVKQRKLEKIEALKAEIKQLEEEVK